MATVLPYRNFNASQDAEALKKAMKGLGTDEQAIIDVLASRCTTQRQEIAKQFKTMYGEDLISQLKKELSGNFEKSVLLGFSNPAQLNAKACYDAMKGAGTKERVLLQVLCTATKPEIAQLKSTYKETYGKELEDAIKDDCGGDFGRLLIALVQGRREESCSENQAVADAASLYEAGEAKMGTDESNFTKILVTRSWEQIRLINRSYEQHVSHDLLKAIDKELSGDYKEALQLIVKSAGSRPAAIAELLYNSMAGAGTSDDDLQRLIMSYSETELKPISHAYAQVYGKSLAEAVSGDTSRDYKKWLLAIIGSA